MTSWLANLRVRFLLLVLLAVLPALGLLIVMADEQRDQAVELAQEETRRLAGLAAADQGRLIESTRQLLVVLARLPEIRPGHPACPGLLAALRAQFPLYANLGVVTPDGTLVCSAVPPPAPLNLGDRAYVRRAIETGEFAIGEYQIGRVTGQPALNGGYPVHDPEGNLLGVVYASIDLATLGEFAAEAQLPDDAILTVFDRSGRVLVRQPDDGRVGQLLVGTPVVDRMLREGRGVSEAREEGQTYLYAFEPLGGANPGNAYLSIAIPRARVVAPAEEAFARHLTRMGLVGLVVLVAAWVGGDLMVRRNTEAAKALVRRIYDAFTTGRVDLLDDVVASDFRDHDPAPGQAPGLAGLKQAVGFFRAAFPDGELVVDELVAEGDKVVARVRLRGTQHGEFFGVPPSGRLVSAEGIEIYRIAGGKVVEGWSRFVPPAAVAGAGPGG